MRKGKKIIALLLVTILALTSLTACGGKGGNASNGDDSDYAESINIMIWEGSYPEEVFQKFEEEYGIHVNISYITNTDEILAKLLVGADSEFDFIDIESAYVKPFTDNDLLEKINWDNIPNSKNLYEQCWGIPGDEDREYVCPIGASGYTLIVYNKETCPIEITKFTDLADPALKNQICSVNSTISLFGVALEALGYEADSVTESEYEEVTELWKEIKSNVKVFTGSSSYQTLENGECSVGFMFDYPILMQDEENWDKYAVADIDTPYETYSTTWGVPKGSSHQKEAELLMNFMLRDEIYAERIEYYPNQPMTDGVKELLPESILDSPAFNLPDSIVGDCWMVPVSDEQISLMDKYLTEFMSTDQ